MTIIDFSRTPSSEKQKAPRLIELGAGRLGLWGKPSPGKLGDWQSQGLTTVLTLLSTAEGAQHLGEAVLRMGLVWHWFEQANGQDLPAPRRFELLRELQTINREIDAGSWVLIHCAAGMHRTGMASYALLRLRGLDRAAALDLMQQMRPVTREGVGEKRLDWVDAWLAEFRIP
ncbi:MAG: tyrosine-protein phosphatase [Anaerolineaceae bacterium]|nr:tyrosine-protein phosphatase [Anaerolineaceae bacterium]